MAARTAPTRAIPPSLNAAAIAARSRTPAWRFPRRPAERRRPAQAPQPRRRVGVAGLEPGGAERGLDRRERRGQHIAPDLVAEVMMRGGQHRRATRSPARRRTRAAARRRDRSACGCRRRRPRRAADRPTRDAPARPAADRRRRGRTASRRARRATRVATRSIRPARRRWRPAVLRARRSVRDCCRGRRRPRARSLRPGHPRLRSAATRRSRATADRTDRGPRPARRTLRHSPPIASMTAIWSVSGQHAKLRPRGTAGAGARRGARSRGDGCLGASRDESESLCHCVHPRVRTVRPVDSACRRGVLDLAGFDAKLRRPAQERPAWT